VYIKLEFLTISSVVDFFKLEYLTTIAG